jgi:hypothetical protein
MLEQIVYQIKDLKNLSASAFYTGDLPPMGPGGFGVSNGKDSYGFRTPIFSREGSVDGDSISGYESSETIPVIPRFIGTSSEFKKGSYGNLFANLDLGKIFPKDPDAEGTNLQERYDFAERDGESPHLNLGFTRKKGYIPFGDFHKVDLSDED